MTDELPRTDAAAHAAGEMHPAAGEPLLRIEGVAKTFGTFRAVDGVSLDIKAGEFFALLGPSGCGKTTLLRMLAGFEAPDEGRILLGGKDIAQVLPHERPINMMFQNYALFPHLNVRDNIAFGLRRAGVDAAEIARRVDYVIGFMRLRDFTTAYTAQLSGGMRQRVCIARTLVLQPRLFLLDEPFGALDQQTRLLMGDELLRLWRETGATILLITHALDEAAMLSDRVGVMSARPGRFIDVITTAWPRERDSAIVAERAFGAVTARLWSLLRAESLKAIGARGA